MKKIAIVGAGSSSLFLLLELAKNNYKEKIIVIEKGNSLLNRKDNEVISGFGGAGLYSDCKLIFSPEIGGEISEYLSNDKILSLSDKLYDFIMKYTGEIKPTFQKGNYQDFKPFDILIGNVLHVGTDYGRIFLSQVYEELEKYLDITFLYETEVLNITKSKIDKNYFIIYQKGSELDYVLADKVILATGKTGTKLINKVIDYFSLKSEENNCHIGIRVEVDHYITKKLTDEYYDFKLSLSNDLGKVRSFCVSPYGEVIEESIFDQRSFNGGSSKEVKTDKTNFGIIYNGKFSTFSKTKEIVSKFNNLNDKNPINYSTFINNPIYINIFGEEIFCAINNWMVEFDNICPNFLINVKINIPEVKYTSKKMRLSENFSNDDSLFIIGDAYFSRGIYQSALSGLYVAEKIIEDAK